MRSNAYQFLLIQCKKIAAFNKQLIAQLVVTLLTVLLELFTVKLNSKNPAQDKGCSHHPVSAYQLGLSARCKLADNMNNLAIITQHFNDAPISIRPDGYWNLTQMCKTYNKRINNFLRIDGTEAYLVALAKRLNLQLVENSASESIVYVPGISPKTPNGATAHIENSASEKPLIEVYKGGVPELQGTWGHQRVALKLSAWLNEDLEVWVYEVIEKLLVQGKVELRYEIEGLRQALQLKESQLSDLECEHAVLEYRRDRLMYELDEIRDVVNWRLVGESDHLEDLNEEE